MKSFYRILFAGVLAGLFVAASCPADAQRRGRPGSMRHTQEDVENARKITPVKAKYIHDGSTFRGQALMTGDAGAIKVGDVVLSFRGGKYNFSFDAATFEMRTSKSKDQLLREGITQYEYDRSWKNEKMWEDFSSSGEYEVVEQYGKISLLLYVGSDKSQRFMTVPLENANVSSFQCEEGVITFDMSLSQ